MLQFSFFLDKNGQKTRIIPFQLLFLAIFYVFACFVCILREKDRFCAVISVSPSKFVASVVLLAE